MRTTLRLVSALPAMLLLVPTLPAWDEAVHRAIARVAKERIGPNAARRHRYYLGKAKNLEDLSYWAETVYGERPETESWHSITIPPNATALDLKRDCPLGDCVTIKIREQQGIVRLAHKKRSELVEALRFLVNLVSDLHQPLNVGYPPGFGLEDEMVIYRGRKQMIHEFWDRTLFEGLSTDELAERIRGRISEEKAREWTQGNAKSWTWDTHLTAVRVAYGALPSGSPKKLEQDYVSAARAAAEEQLAKAAVRLAHTLDEAWP